MNYFELKFDYAVKKNKSKNSLKAQKILLKSSDKLFSENKR
jgi:hypothetical protein